MNFDDTIAAPATGNGGAIAVIRISGRRTAEICDSVFISPKGRTVAKAEGYTMIYGRIVDNDTVIDDAVVAIYKTPHSYTGEDMVEISCHASQYIVSQIMKALSNHGARAAHAGEFTQRAFLNGKMDLSQAEAVADIIASHDKASHYIASKQMRGGYSEQLGTLRGKMLKLVSLMELELDFGEEDVEFVDRSKFISLLYETETEIDNLTKSFAYGNAIKEGVKVAIVGSPNVGKSTLLNTLLNEERAIVSDIAGTTRDVIEDTIKIGGIDFRLTDTAGLRDSDEIIEKMGIERTIKAVEQARIVLIMFDANTVSADTVRVQIKELKLSPEQKMCVLLNKCDIKDAELNANRISASLSDNYNMNVIKMSAKHNAGIDKLNRFLEESSNVESIYSQAITISNSRHYEALMRADNVLKRIRKGLEQNLPTDMIVEDIREMLADIGEITGEITTEEILGEIFSKFCIGK